MLAVPNSPKAYDIQNVTKLVMEKPIAMLAANLSSSESKNFKVAFEEEKADFTQPLITARAMPQAFGSCVFRTGRNDPDRRSVDWL